MSDVTLLVDGVRHGGWKSVRIRRSLEELASSFTLGVSERWSGQDQPRRIRPGARCELLLGAERIIVGHVDDVSVRYDARTHEVEVTGRDVTGDLVDATAPARQFQGRDLSAVAEDLCGPFGIKVQAEGTGAPFSSLCSEPGQTVFEVLETAARLRGAHLLSDGLGGLRVVLDVAREHSGAALRLGQNIMACSAATSHRDRHDIYTVLGQSPGSDDWSGEAAAQAQGMASDPEVRRHRPLTIVADGPLTSAGATDRAAVEATVRAARARRITYTVTGWRHARGVWAPGYLCTVHDPFLDLDGSVRLIAGVTLLLDNQGTRAELDLLPPEAFTRAEVAEPDPEEGPW